MITCKQSPISNKLNQIHSYNIIPYQQIFIAKNKYVGLIAVMLGSLLYNILFFNNYYPITEGWFSVYSHLIRQGLVPYRDFYLYLTPLYPLLIAGFQSIFGESILALRILGIIIIQFFSIFLFLILSRNFTPLVATISTLTAIIYYQSGVAHITYDFIQLFTLFVLSATYFIIRYSDIQAKDALKKANPSFLFVSGILISSAFLIKHSNGTLVVIFSMIAVTLATAGQEHYYRIRSIFIYMLGMILPVTAIGIWLYFVNAFIPFMNQSIFGAIDAKGSLPVILFSWMSLFNLSYFIQLTKLILLASPLFAISLIGFFLSKNQLTKKRQCDDNQHIISIIIYLFIYGIILYISYFHYLAFDISLTNNFRVLANNLIIVASTALMATFLFLYIAPPFINFRISDRGLALCAIMTFGLIFGNGTSAGISEVSVFISFAFVLSLLMSLQNSFGISKFTVSFASLCFIFLLSNCKFRQPYAWWNITVPDLQESTTHSVLPLLKGFWLPPDSTKVLEDVTKLIQINTSPNENIFTFPNIPVFYILSNRWPNSKVVVSWFDFLPDIPARAEAVRVLANPPKIIVNLKLPEETWTAHERLFRKGKPLGQRDILDAITELTEHRKLYHLELSKVISPGCKLEVWNYVR